MYHFFLKAAHSEFSCGSNQIADTPFPIRNTPAKCQWEKKTVLFEINDCFEASNSDQMFSDQKNKQQIIQHDTLEVTTFSNERSWKTYQFLFQNSMLNEFHVKNSLSSLITSSNIIVMCTVLQIWSVVFKSPCLPEFVFTYAHVLLLKSSKCPSNRQIYNVTQFGNFMNIKIVWNMFQMLKIESTAIGSISHGVGLGVLFNITGGNK